MARDTGYCDTCRLVRDCHRSDARHRSSFGGDRPAFVYGVWQPVLQLLPGPADCFTDRSNLLLCDLAIRRMACPGVGRNTCSHDDDSGHKHRRANCDTKEVLIWDVNIHGEFDPETERVRTWAGK